MKTKSTIFTVLLAGLLFSTLFSCKQITELLSHSQPPPTVKDIDGNIYHTVLIGNQIWMVEDLNVKHYQNGDPLTLAADIKDSIQGAYLNENKDKSLLSPKRYNWTAVIDKRKIAPAGWHVPTIAEWKTLTNFLGGESIAGGKLKEAGTAHWPEPNTGATNESGFTALPNQIAVPSTSPDLNMHGYWWSNSTEQNSGKAQLVHLYFESTAINTFPLFQMSYSNDSYMAVRCIKD